jgi:hypothetical protein
MGRIEDRLAQLGPVLPPEVQPPPGVVLPFAFVNIRFDRVIVSGHGLQSADGALAPPFGIPVEVEAEVSIRTAGS